jgi:hypothetical protein
MGMATGLGVADQRPIYMEMFEQRITEQVVFNICLGKNGGFMQIGGYNTDRMLEDISWFAMFDHTN